MKMRQFSNLACGLALDRRASLQLGQRRTKVKALIKYKLKKSRLFKALTLQAGPGTLTHHPLFVIGSLY